MIIDHLDFPFAGTVVSVDVDPGDTVGQVKQKISLKEGIPPDQQQLIFSGMSLADDQMINTYNIQRDSTVHLVIKMSSESSAGGKPRSEVHARKEDDPPPPPLNQSKSVTTTFNSSGTGIFASSHGQVQQQQRNDLFILNCYSQLGRQFRVNARNTDTIYDLKERLAVQEGIRLSQNDIILHVGDIELNNRETLGYYGITPTAAVRMQVVPKSVSTLFIKTLNGKTFILYPAESSKVSEIKRELAEKSGIPAAQQRLVYQGVDLPDTQTLSQCNVPSQCTLHVIQTNPPVPSRPSFPLLIKTFIGKTITVMVSHGDTVRNVKEMINTKEGYPEDEIVIMLGGSELEDDKILDHYEIQQGSTLLVTFKPKDKVKLAVFNTSKSKIIYLDDVVLSENISQIEHRLSLELSVPRDIITLACNGLILNRHLTAQQCNITKDSVVYLYTSQPETFSLTVATLAGVKCQVTISSFQSVAMMKMIVEDMLGVPANQQVLLQKGNCLNDEAYVSECVALNNRNVFLFTKHGVSRNINVAMPNVNTVQLAISADMTVLQLKAIVAEKQRVSVEHISLSYKGSELEDPYTIGDYAITDGAELNAIVLSRDPFSVVVHADNGSKPFTLQVNGTDNVQVLKHKVAASLKLPAGRVCLSYNGTYLVDRCLIRECNLPSLCVLLAELRSE